MLITRPGRDGLLAELADEGLGEKERALEIDVHDLVEVLLGDVPEVGSDFDAGVVDEDVAAAVLGVGLVDKGLGLGNFGDVGLEDDGLAAG